MIVYLAGIPETPWNAMCTLENPVGNSLEFPRNSGTYQNILTGTAEVDLFKFMVEY